MGLWSRIKKRMGRRSPAVAGFLNFIALGLGYLYAGRKKLVGFSLLALVWTWLTIVGVVLTGGKIPAPVFYPATAGTTLFACLALARDAYIETEKRNDECE